MNRKYPREFLLKFQKVCSLAPVILAQLVSLPTPLLLTRHRGLQSHRMNNNSNSWSGHLVFLTSKSSSTADPHRFAFSFCALRTVASTTQLLVAGCGQFTSIDAAESGRPRQLDAAQPRRT